MSAFQSNQNRPDAEAIRQQVEAAVKQATQSAVQAAQDAKNAANGPQAPKAPEAPVVIGPVPNGGGRLIIDQQGNRTTITSAALPPELLPMARMAQETALGLVGLIAAMVILGPFARVLARRFDRKGDLSSGAAANNVATQQQLLQLQQSVDAMALEVERISEAQRFQTKLLNERNGGAR